MNPFGRLRWFLGRLVSPVRSVVPGSLPSTGSASPAAPEEGPDDERQDEAQDEEDAVPEASPNVWLVVGLGNPGPSYAGHRHNIGYLVVDELARRMGSPFRAHKSGRADVVEGRLGAPGTDAPRVVLAKSRSYMNEVGGPIKALAAFYKVGPERIVVIHDELDIDFGQLRVKRGGGDNGHNGLKSLRSSFGSGEFLQT